MLYRLALAVIVIAVHALGTSASQPIDWSGTWTSRGGQDVEILRNVHGLHGTARGWNGFVERLDATRGYSISIAHTADEVVVTFPGGASNMLTVPGFAFGNQSRATVVNRGEWWTKHVTSARRVGGSLELTAVTCSGWWKNGEPERADPKPTDFRMRLTLTPGTGPDALLLQVALSDEKGELEYVQRFHRGP